MKRFFVRLWKEQIAQDTTEYALLLLLFALAAITSTKTLANGIKNAYSNVGNSISSRTGGGGGGNNGGGNNGGGNNGGGNDGGGNDGGGNNRGGNNRGG